jgi:outer membrane protein OmpA-like peptidoglycan-associated protein
MMRVFLTFFLSIAILFCARAQQNLVPNPGFETAEALEDPWFYNGSHLGKSVHFWESPTGASPDAYHPSIKVPIDWKERGFGKQKPHSGKGMTGLTVYGCTNGKPHCREYLMSLLNEPVIPNQYYYIEFWLCRLDGGLTTDRIGVAFSQTKVRRTLDDILPMSYTVQNDLKKQGSDARWAKVSGIWKADAAYDYLLIGNFTTDSDTRYRADGETRFTYGYYYIDDVLVKRVPPYLKALPVSDDLLDRRLAVDDYVRLRDIYFDFDRSMLHPRSEVELTKLRTILTRHPKMYVELIGHTDSDGDSAYNQKLSVARAEAARKWLITKGIGAKRIKTLGRGEEAPIDTNETDEGRAMNRRVELHVLKL